jgi:uncharacterized protein involved in exopolysaccharide biosynthesis
MKEQQQSVFAEDDTNFGGYFAAIRPHLWKIILLSLAVGILVLFLLFLKKNLYKSTAIITPAPEDGKQVSALGALASFGISIGGPTKIEDLEALFKSDDLTVRVFHKYNVWPFIFQEDFDAKKKKLKIKWTDRLLGEQGEYKKPGDWDAIRAAEDNLRISVNRKMGTLSISFESPSPEGSATIVRYYLEEGKSRLQEEAFERANKNKKFIEEQISNTVDALNRDRLYSLYGQEVEKEMLARNREQFGFTIVDSPRVPDRKSWPPRILYAFLASILFFLVSIVICGEFRNRGATSN